MTVTGGGKGNKERQIAVSDAMLNTLKHYRKYLGQSTLPSDTTPLLLKSKGKGPIEVPLILGKLYNHALTIL